MSAEIKFGTDGWRAVIGKNFNLKNVEMVAQGIADYLKLNAKYKRLATKVIVGYDTRKLSKEAARIVSQVLAANGIKIILSNRPLPVQAVSYAVKHKKCTAAVMVTASHNPVYFNGIKIKGSFGGPLASAATKKIEKLIFKHKPAKISIHQAQKKGLLKTTNLIPDYLKFLQSYLDMPLLKRGRLKILVDSMHGTADSYIETVLKKTSCKVTTIHKNYDSSFGGIKPEPIFSCLKEASSLMRRGHFDIGLACDGDADRIAALDPQGKFINPQQIISFLLLHLIRYRNLKGAVVKTISGTALLERIARKYKLKVYETPVGFKHISAFMRKKDVLIGGEEAGGIGFKNYIPERDGILAGLLLVEMLIVRGKSITDLLKDIEEEFGPYFYLRKDIKYKSSDRDKIKARFTALRSRKIFFDTKIAKIKDYDGLKFYLAGGGWILFRFSGTEPIFRIYAESSSVKRTRQLIAEGKKILSG